MERSLRAVGGGRRDRPTGSRAAPPAWPCWTDRATPATTPTTHASPPMNEPPTARSESCVRCSTAPCAHSLGTITGGVCHGRAPTTFSNPNCVDRTAGSGRGARSRTGHATVPPCTTVPQTLDAPGNPRRRSELQPRVRSRPDFNCAVPCRSRINGDRKFRRTVRFDPPQCARTHSARGRHPTHGTPTTGKGPRSP
jgi:hypothetical protein